MTLCFEDYCLENPELLLLVIPAFLLLLLFIYRDFISFRNTEEKIRFHKQKKPLRFFVLCSRTLIVFFLLAGLALPFTTTEVTTHGDPVIKVLVDSSESMEVFDPDILDALKKKLEGTVPLEISQISSGRRSELGDGVFKKIEGGDNLLLISDGNNHFGKDLRDIGLYSRLSDTTLFALDMEEVRNDAFVMISGPGETIAGTSNTFTVSVDFIGNQPAFTLQIFVDDKLEFSGSNTFKKDITKTFGEGFHKISAKIILEDYFEQNNIYYKTVKAVPKPRILFVSRHSSPIEEGLRSIYDLKRTSSLPQNLQQYSALVLNDIGYADLKNRLEDLTGFLIEGGGILFIGGRNSFDRGDYEETLLESLLPVTVGTGRIIDPLKHNIVIVLDVSDSFSDFAYKKGTEKSGLDLGKGMAIGMIENFRDDIGIGIVAFASIGQIVADIEDLGDSRESLINTLERIRGGEGTSIDQGLLMGEYALDGAKGTKNVILISDGKTPNRKDPPAPKAVAQRMAKKGIRIYTVGLPSLVRRGQEDINREYMQRLAEIGGGSYFEPEDYQFLNVFFGKPEAKEKVFSGSSNLAVIDKNHFITQQLGLSSRVTGINFVVPKPGARNLVFTGDGNPVVNSWNFGLGRVVTFASDDGREWSASLLERENSKLLTRMINYAVGNPERDKDPLIDSSDGFLGEDNVIAVRSEKHPVSKDLTFVKEGDRSYKAVFNPEEEGFYQFFDALVAINPHREYYQLGRNPLLEEMAELSGGSLLDVEDDDLYERIRSYSERSQIQRADLSLYPLGLALLIFIVELFIRKVYEQRNARVIS